MRRVSPGAQLACGDAAWPAAQLWRLQARGHGCHGAQGHRRLLQPRQGGADTAGASIRCRGARRTRRCRMVAGIWVLTVNVFMFTNLNL
jgi:hypothetical protein